MLVSPSGNTFATPINQTVNHGETATFNCTAEGGPGTLIQWLYNGTERLCSSNCSAASPNPTTDIDGV